MRSRRESQNERRRYNNNNNLREKHLDGLESCDNEKYDKSRDKDFKDKENYKKSYRFFRGRGGRQRNNKNSFKKSPLDYPDYPVEYTVSHHY